MHAHTRTSFNIDAAKLKMWNFQFGIPALSSSIEKKSFLKECKIKLLSLHFQKCLNDVLLLMMLLLLLLLLLSRQSIQRVYLPHNLFLFAIESNQLLLGLNYVVWFFFGILRMILK